MADPPKPSFSLSLGPAKSKPPTRKPPSTFAAKRSAAHLDSDDEDDAEDTHTAKVQLVTAFDTTRGGAVDLNNAPQEKGPLVIPKLSNRNWREEAERRRGGKKAIYLPPEVLAKQQGGLKPEDLVETDKAEQKYGLQVFERKEEEQGAGVEEPAAPTDAPPSQPEKQQTEEELALASLLRGDAPAPSTLVLAPTAASGGNDWRAARAAAGNEDAAFKTDVASRPEMATLEDYAAVPVEEFGAALLRGMGWKEGDEVGKRRGAAVKPRVVERRAAFLGIGAKAKEEVMELGTWGKGDKKSRRRRQDTTYVPVVMIDKKTGKVVDPAEAEAKEKEKEKEKGVDGKKWERGEENGRKEENGRGAEAQKRERSRERDRDRDRERDRDRRERRGSYDSSDRRRRDRERSKDRSSGGKDRDRDRDRDRERRRGDDDRDRRRGDERRGDDSRSRRDRDRRDRR